MVSFLKTFSCVILNVAECPHTKERLIVINSQSDANVPGKLI